jgi:uncharacterized protein YuzE
MPVQRVPNRLLQVVDEDTILVDVTTGDADYVWRRQGADVVSFGLNKSMEINNEGNIAGLRIKESSTPTTDLAEGQIYKDSTTGELYYYDDVRSKFLSFKEETVVLNRRQPGAMTSTVALRLGDMVTSNANTGALLDRDGTIVGITIIRNSGTGAMDIEVRRDASTQTLITKTLSAATTEVIDNSLNVNVSSGYSLQGFTTNNATNGANAVSVVLKIRLRA